ncbi:MAG TPA: hypothetical protein VGC79_36145, partial [Polyangiaceae bacterium]
MFGVVATKERRACDEQKRGDGAKHGNADQSEPLAGKRVRALSSPDTEAPGCRESSTEFEPFVDCLALTQSQMPPMTIESTIRLLAGSLIVISVA